MKKLKRLLYLGYYLKNTEGEKFWRFVNSVKAEKKRTSFDILADVLFSSVKYNISFLEFFYFRFYNLNAAERQSYAGTGFMYEYQRIMNPVDARECLDNKISFYEMYAQFVKHKVASLTKLKNEKGTADLLLRNSAQRIVLKD